MKKVYITPQTEAVKLLSENTIMSVSMSKGIIQGFGPSSGGMEPV